MKTENEVKLYQVNTEEVTTEGKKSDDRNNSTDEIIAVDPSKKDDNKGSNVTLTAANIANNMVGAGIISLPLAFKDSGIGLGIILLGISSIACGWTICIMGMCGELNKTITYEKTVKKILGKVAYVIIIICTIISPLKGTATYAVALADNLTIFFRGIVPSVPQLQIRAVVLVIPFYAIILPLSLPKNLSYMDKFSTLSIILVMFYVVTILYKSYSIPPVIQTLPDAYTFARSNAVKALPVFAFACSCHYNAVSFYRSLKNRDVTRFKLAKDIAIYLAFVLYIIVAVAGYITFGGYPFGNLFRNYCDDDLLMNIARVVFCFTLFLTAPMQIFGVRNVLMRELLSRWKDKTWIHLLITFSLVSLCFIVGSLVDNLSIVIELGSAISTVPIVYIFPALCAIKMYGRPYLPSDLKRIIAWSILLFGIFMIIASPVFTILDEIHSQSLTRFRKYFCDA